MTEPRKDPIRKRLPANFTLLPITRTRLKRLSKYLNRSESNVVDVITEDYYEAVFKKTPRN